MDWRDIIKESSIFDGIEKNVLLLITFCILLVIFTVVLKYCNRRLGDKEIESMDSYEKIKKDL